MALRTRKTDPVNQAHTLGGGALALFEQAKADLEEAARVLGAHAQERRQEALVAADDAYQAETAANKYFHKANKISEFLD